jgi:putative transcriptional regulator
METTAASLGRNIRTLRTSLGLTQAELAALVGTRQETVCYIERGRASVSVPRLLAFADALGTSPGYLLSEPSSLAFDGRPPDETLELALATQQHRRFSRERARHRRLVLGMTQGELAAKVGVSRQSINNMERGKTTPAPRTLVRLAIALNTSIRSFIHHSEAA